MNYDYDIARREVEIERLFRTAVASQKQQRFEHAVYTARTALAELGALMERRPAPDPGDLAMSGSLQYLCASLYMALGRGEEAERSLDDAEGRYRELIADDQAEAVPRLADVRMRRATLRMYQGRGASAVSEADQALSVCLRLAESGLLDPLDLARVLALGAPVLFYFGDRMMGRELAASAIHLYERVDITPQDPTHGDHLEQARELEELGEEGTGLSLGGALHWAAEHMDAAKVGSVRHLLLPGDGERYPLCPSDRVPGEAAVVAAKVLADLAADAVAYTDEAPAVCVRLGTEAHYLFEAASRRDGPAPRHDFGDFGPSWAKALHACCGLYAVDNLPMAEDLSRWAAGVVGDLMPFAVLDPDVARVARDCLTQRGEILLAMGEEAEGRSCLAAARDLGGG
jgi:tetratricopeptide (TPR) repeat protein